jgi:hypothetical protein
VQGSARRDTSARASALAGPARTFIVYPCCENPAARFRSHRRTHAEAVTDEPRLLNPRLRSESWPDSTGHPELSVFSAWNAQGRGMRRAAQPARAAGGSEADPATARSRPPRRPPDYLDRKGSIKGHARGIYSWRARIRYPSTDGFIARALIERQLMPPRSAQNRAYFGQRASPDRRTRHPRVDSVPVPPPSSSTRRIQPAHGSCEVFLRPRPRR